MEYDLEEEGLYELVCLYKLLLALDGAKSESKIVLDLREFDFLDEPLKESKTHFVNKVTCYRHLFKYAVGEDDKILLGPESNS
jgi:hypothetical protein